MKLTRRIQLKIDTPDPKEKKVFLDQLYHWQNITFRAANMIASHLYFQEQLKDFIYLTEGAKVKLCSSEKDPKGLLTCSKTNSTYKIISNAFKGQIPSAILTDLNQAVVSVFNKERPYYQKGERSLRTFKKDIPFPFGSRNITGLNYNELKNSFIFSVFKVPFRTYLGKDLTDKKQLLYKVIEGELKLCTSHIQLKDRKIFWLPVFDIPCEQHELKEEIIAEASLSVEYPILVTIGKAKATIGNREEFLYRRLAIQSAKQRLQSAVPYNKGGHGKKRKLRSLNKYSDAEKRYVRNKLHLYSRRLIDFCIKHQAGTLLLVNQASKEEIARGEPFLLRNWSYYDLVTKIKYKAAKAGIEVIME